MRHQEGQVHAAGQSGRAEEQHEDAAAAEPAAQAGPQAESPEEGEDERQPFTSLCIFVLNSGAHWSRLHTWLMMQYDARLARCLLPPANTDTFMSLLLFGKPKGKSG